ncbi:MAG TPA: ethanolamine ammonia-lyase subunit EutC [Candidatus Binataceae bacterium]
MRGRTESPDFATLARATPARIGLGRAGTRYTTKAQLELRADHARAVDAVVTEVSAQWPRRNKMLELHSRARSREEFLLKPELGRMLSDESTIQLRKLSKKFAAASAKPSVLVCVGDGLSSHAVEVNAAPLVRKIIAALGNRYRTMPPIFIRNARVRIEDHLGELLAAGLVCMLIGERPGLVTSESLSAYVIYRPRLNSLEPDRTVISNIHRGGLKLDAAARQISTLIADAIRLKGSGNALAHSRSPSS